MVEGTCRVIIAEDHTILREGLRALLEGEKGRYQVVGEAGDGLEAIRSVEEQKPDILLVDLSMPKLNGMSAIAEIKKRCPNTKILALTVHKQEEYVLEAFRAGANGYCLKEADQKELKDAIECILAGRTFFSPEISAKVLNGYLEDRKNLTPENLGDKLSRRERDVLKLIGEGFKNREIADFLFISPKTVEKHRANIMNKLNLHNVAALTSYAIEKGLVSR